MKKCSDCNVEMIEKTNLHTDYVGGTRIEEEIYLDYADEENGFNVLFSNEKKSIRRVKARLCPQCGKVELFVDLNEKE
jgi:ssDNA-binding Zn-finger/Zn-ribbon topoisomerase 1